MEEPNYMNPGKHNSKFRRFLCNGAFRTLQIILFHALVGVLSLTYLILQLDSLRLQISA